MRAANFNRLAAGFALSAAVIAGSVVAAPQASAVTGGDVWVASDGRAYSQCSGGGGYQRAGASCAVNGFYVGTTYGQWVRAGQVSVANCGFPRSIEKRSGRPVVWWETRS